VKVTGREKKFLFIGGAIAAAVIVYFAFAATSLLPDRATLREDVETQQGLLLRQRTLLARESAYKKRADENKADLEKAMTRLLPGDNASVAGSELQRILKEFADDSGVEITQKNNLAERKVPDSDSLVKVSVRIDTNCDLGELVDFLSAIENYEKFLKVEELVVNTNVSRAQKQVQIRPSLTVVGYIDAPPPPKPAGAPAAGGTT